MSSSDLSPYEENEQNREEVIDDSGRVVDFRAARRERGIASRSGPEGTGDPPGEDGGELVPVDPDDRDVPAESLRDRLDARTGQRRDIVAPWLRDRDELRYATRWAGGHVVHTSAYHLLRVPKYTARVAGRTPVGAAKLAGATLRWVGDAEARPLRSAAVLAEDAEVYMRLAKIRHERIRWRLVLLGLIGLGLAVAVVAVLALTPWWGHILAAGAAIGVLAAFGSSPDRPLIDRNINADARSPKLTADIVTRALGALGIAEINRTLAKDPAGISFPSPIVRDGPGWRATVDLPHGVTATDIIERRDKLASGLRRPLGCVWPEGVHDEHEGRLVLWVGDRDLTKSRQPVWPLARTGTVDVFAPAPFGTDQRSRWVNITLAYTSGVTGSVPRMGKTFAQRELALIAGLDPRCQLHLYDLKGTGDLSPLEAIAHRYRAGDDEDDIEYAIADMRALADEQRRRTKVIRDLPRDICPENKVTSELADRKSLGLFPVFVDVDECQIWFEHPTYGKEFEAICTDLVKRGPAAGIMLYLATQRPDAHSIPMGISANAVTRLCLKVRGQVENDMVLGTSAYKNGIRATMFAFADKGVAYLVGEGADAQIVRTVAGLDALAAERIAARARAAREKAGTITGHAAGETIEAGPDISLLDDIRAVTAESETKIWSETILARLGELRPEVYGGWKPAQLAAALKPFGIGTAQVWGQAGDGTGGANRRGIARADVIRAITERDRRKEADPD